MGRQLKLEASYFMTNRYRLQSNYKIENDTDYLEGTKPGGDSAQGYPSFACS
jgi:hypothetical protein